MRRAKSSRKQATAPKEVVEEIANLSAPEAEVKLDAGKVKKRAKKNVEPSEAPKTASSSIFDTPIVPVTKKTVKKKRSASITETQDSASNSKSASMLSYVKNRAADVAQVLLPAKRLRNSKKEAENGGEAVQPASESALITNKKSTRIRGAKKTNKVSPETAPITEPAEDTGKVVSRRRKNDKPLVEETPAAAEENNGVLPKVTRRGKGKNNLKPIDHTEEVETLEISEQTKAKDSSKKKVTRNKKATTDKKQKETSVDTAEENKDEDHVKANDVAEPSTSKSKKKIGAVAPFVTVARGRKRAVPADSENALIAVNGEGAAKGKRYFPIFYRPSQVGFKTSVSKKDKPLVNSTYTDYVKEDFNLSPMQDQDPNVLRYNLKISSWNVAGIRSWLKKDGLTFLEFEEPDIFCLQEIKCSTDQIPAEISRLNGYHPYWNCNRGGYAGVALYSKIMPINVEYGINDKSFDEHGRIITAEYEKFYLINVYVPNSGRKLVNLEERMRWEKLFQEHVKKLDAIKPVIICGDMNVSRLEIDLANPKTNLRNAGFTIEERDKMSELLALGFVDTFRLLYPDRTGAYTFWSYMGNARARNVGWRLDYFIVSERFVNRIVENCMRTQCKGSDHCPITLFLKL